MERARRYRWRVPLALAALTLLALLLGSKALLGWAAAGLLARAGYAEATVTVLRLGPAQAEASVDLGADQDLPRILLDYRLAGLLAGRLERVRIEGGRLALPLGRLAGAATPSPRWSLERLEVSGTVLHLVGLEHAPDFALTLDLDYRRNPAGASAAAQLRAVTGIVAGELTAHQDAVAGWTLELKADSADPAGLARLAGLTAPLSGRLRLEARTLQPWRDRLPSLALRVHGEALAWQDVVERADLEFGARLNRIGNGAAYRLDGDQTISVEMLPAPALRERLGLPAAPLRLELAPAGADGTWGLLWNRAGDGSRLTLQPAHLRFDHAVGTLQGELRRFTLEHRPDDDERPLRLRLEAGTLRLTHPRLRLPPLHLAGEASGDGQRWRLEASANGPDGVPTLTLQSRHEPGQGQAQLRLAPLEFVPGRHQPADFWPALYGVVTEARGRIGGSVRWRWDAQGRSNDGELALERLTAAGPLGRIEGLDGRLIASGLWPLHLPEWQRLRIARLELGGLPLSDGQVAFTLAGDRLEVNVADFTWAGGRLRLAPFSARSRDTRWDVVLELEAVQLAQLLDLLRLEGLRGSGTLSGRLPLGISDSGVQVNDGRLAADGAGELRYDPAEPPAFLAEASDPNLVLLRQALRDFRYQRLELALDGAVGGEMSATGRIEGSSPQFQDGRPLALNLNLSGALAALLRDSADAYRLPETLRQRLQRLLERSP
ncbi:MAG TPA: YdbH domain-containing protein [Candidatus Competibacteraceae bacterium]|nr:YdbH domain-containing protein [Candidatus Competibacteraceae bacterium]